MAIRLTRHAQNIALKPASQFTPPRGDSSPHDGIAVAGPLAALAYCDTEAEAEQARRAFEQVLAPRFTRDEAIALCLRPRSVRYDDADGNPTPHPERTSAGNSHEEVWAAGYDAGMRAALEALAAAGVFVDGKNMRDRLDAAGIR